MDKAMFLSIKDSIPFVVIQKRSDGDIERGMTDMSWPSLVNILSKHEVRSQKNGASIIPVRFKPKDQWVLTPPRDGVAATYRNKDNVEAITIAIIDLDKPGALETARSVLKDYEYVVYSTHSYTSETPYKFRMVIKLQDPIEVANWPLAFSCLVKDIDADLQCGNADRIYYLPAASPHAGIAPFFEHNKGKPLSFENILRMGGDNPHELLEKKIQERKTRRHFIGELAEGLALDYGSNLIEQIQWSWNAMLERQTALIDDLRISDSRHHFALRLIGSEISKFREQVNIPALVSFVYKAASEFSSKPLTMGNTPHEIPEHIESAFRKYCSGDDPVRAFEQANGITLKVLIAQSISQAALSQATGKWLVDKPISLLPKATNVPSDNAMRMLQRANMHELIKSADIKRYAKDTLVTYLNSMFEFKSDAFAKFLIESLTSYVNKFSDKGLSHSLVINEIKQLDFKEVLKGKADEKFGRFVNASVKKYFIKNEQAISVGI
ncbi:hypothetical protein ACI2KR_07390 [Pseudomonas luteola]